MMLSEEVRAFKRGSNQRELFISDVQVSMLKDKLGDPYTERAQPCVTLLDHVEASPEKMQSRELLEHACEENTQ
jgi:hypothetical protein